MRANIMNSPDWATVVSARDRVRDYARKLQGAGHLDLRRGRRRDFERPTYRLERQAEEWRQTAENDIRHRTETLQQRKRNRTTMEDTSSDDLNEPPSQASIDATAELRERMLEPPESDELDDVSDAKSQQLKLRLKFNSKKWSYQIVRNFYNYWRDKKYDAFVKQNPRRVVPPALRDEWNGQGLKRYQGLTRPFDYLLFALRTEYIGLLHHRRELCGSDLTDSYCRLCRDTNSSYETITHLLHDCPALKEERGKLYEEVFSTVSSIKSFADMRRDIIVKAPELVVKFALEHFKIDQLKWTREHLLDLLLNPEVAEDWSGSAAPEGSARRGR